ncbi:hypothetical protein BT93_I0415 [Corymbia citriodora subsp. variegata]|nr:hypothetical protein BT93_I0415 [Corymbia citriodora subsp. variegata]
MMQASKQQPLQQAQQQQLILQNSSGSLSFSNMSLSREDKEMSRLALSTFRAKEEEIKRKKMEVHDCVLSHLGRVEEETKYLATIHKNSSRSLSLSSSNMLLSRKDEAMSRPALSTFMAKEEGIQKKKIIHKQNGSEDDSGKDKAAEEKRQVVVKQMRRDIALLL